ncbi:MAG: sodium ion-translocating decarboxylase subunit beta [Lachnospiraceae bacterium]|nr:sodium ion-translocating decarboxylase subunit beta [Lachnospiraceae bacterium]
MGKITIITASLITALMLAGCANVNVTVKNDTAASEQDSITVIGGSDGPTSIYLAPDTDREENRDGADEFLAGTWSTASQGYEYYGKAQAEYYVRFDGTDIIYGHMKDEEFVPDHTATISLIEPIPGGGYMVKARAESGAEYTYRSAGGNGDVMEYYSTWDEDDFSNQYRGGASLSRVYDRKVKNTYESDFGKYYEMDDGTWMYEGRIYKYRLEITGRMNNAAKESTFIYLSNIEDIPFDRAVKASGLSNSMADYFSPEEAVFVGWKE